MIMSSDECHRTYITDDKSTLVQVMAWCCLAPSHYLNQCWPRSPTPYGVTRPQWVHINFPTLLLIVWQHIKLSLFPISSLPEESVEHLVCLHVEVEHSIFKLWQLVTFTEKNNNQRITLINSNNLLIQLLWQHMVPLQPFWLSQVWLISSCNIGMTF